MRILKKLGLAAIHVCLLQTTVMAEEEPRFKALIPGLRIERLPVDLTNINSLAYGHDGRLYAAAYNGSVFVLLDSDGDGVEDTPEVFWEKPGDLLTPVGMVGAKEGLYLAVRGKIVLLKDTDGDGVADVSESVVSGWVKEKYNSDRRNDASGITLDAEGNLYFSLGCMSYNKAWMLDKSGKSHYDKADERGTILKVSPDRKSREILATGLRFVIGMEFNRHGDLFATDQEGDTWFPGGNPRDELLHILPGRHYGFPFRHPKYLPDTVDEPEIVGFSPQHQSTCGFRFNENRSGRKAFGPDHWEGDAIVTGFSRGKLWRVPLAKTRAGYVGKQIQIAAFESLLADVAISPDGALLVTAHGGTPDWGSGPAANGHLYKIRYEENEPQPVAAWSAGPLEAKVAFDRPLDPERLKLPEIEMGKLVWEGDGHEWIYPGYEVVEAEKKAVRSKLKVLGHRLSEDRRTVTFTTAPPPWRARYKLTIPGVAAETIEVSYDLGGVEAEWTRKGEKETSWKGWLPHVDLSIARSLMRGSAEHEELFRLLESPGKLTMKSRILLPGRQVGFDFQSNADFEIWCDGVKKSGEFTLEATSPLTEKGESRGGREEVLPTDEIDLKIHLHTGVTGLNFDASYHADFDPHERPLRLEHFFVPWAPRLTPPDPETSENWTSKPIKGDPEKGREIFFGAEANCSLCHTFEGKGGTIGADLSVSVHRGAEAILHDIVNPSASINPEYLSYSVSTKDGKSLVGIFLSADEKEITLIDVAAKTHTILREEIDEIQSLPVSLMPSGFATLGEEKLQNLVAFLCGVEADGSRTGGILREYWLDIPGSGTKALTKHKDYPDKPSGSELLKQFEGPVNWKDNFGARIRGYIHPPQTGDYTFELAADDYAELWLSTTDAPTERVRLINLTRWTPSRDWDRYPEQKSKPVRLEAGKRYYIEAIQYEGRVDDCIAVGWKLPDGKAERPIPGNRLSPFVLEERK